MVYLTLFGWSFLAATIIPLGSEPALVVLVRQGYPVAWLVGVATLGNYLGSATTYVIGRGAARALRRRGVLPDADRPTRLVATYGAPALVLSWVPILGDAIVAAAGAAELRFVTFSFWTILGKCLRYVAVAWGASAWQ
jgi:membrane protein YqaA with SNARE-associated domain